MANVTRAPPSSPDVSRRMQRVRQKNTSAESALRRELYALGLRYRLHVAVLTNPRRVADIAFVGPRVAVFVDGCFWHGCPIHATWPKKNAEFWRTKIIANQRRDRDTDARLHANGWEVARIWAHENPSEVATRIAGTVRARKESSGPLRNRHSKAVPTRPAPLSPVRQNSTPRKKRTSTAPQRKANPHRNSR